MIRRFLSKINFIFVLIAVLFVILLKSTALNLLFKDFSPDIILIIIVYLSFHRFFFEGALLSLIIGWFIEAISGVPHGIIMTTYLWIFTISKMVGNSVFLTRISGTLLVVFIMGLLQTILIWGFTYFVFQATPSLEAYLVSWFPTLFLQLLITPIVFGVFFFFDKFFEKESPAKITGVLGAPILTH